jgi:rod shape determining protein RodA
MIERVVAFAVRHVDPFLAAVVAVLMGIGLVVLYSASGESFARVGGKLMNMAVALSLM